MNECESTRIPGRAGPVSHKTAKAVFHSPGVGEPTLCTYTTESFFLQFCRRAREKQRNFLSMLLSQSAVGAGKRRHTTNKNKLHSVRGGCLGAQCRRRTRRPAKRSGGAAYKR